MPLPTVEKETRPSPSWSVIWLHGLGADGNDFAPIVPELVDRAWPALRFVFPHAPVRPVTVNNGMPMRAWYDIAGASIAQKQDVPGIRASIAEVDALIARENARGVATKNILLAGFSQGGAIALAAGVRHADRLRGIVAPSTDLPPDPLTAAERTDANRDVPIFMAHGRFDPVVPEQLGTISRDVLTTLGYAVDWHAYPMAHQVCPHEISDLQGWIGERLA